MTSPTLSLVTGKVERDDSFNRLVESIIKHTTVDWELVVADASATAYVPACDNIRVIHEKPRTTHVKGYNRAFQSCNGEWLLWLNDDAEVCANYDTEALAFMTSHPTIGLGALHYSENGGQFHVNSAWQTIYANFGIFRKSVGDRVGYFDDEMIMYGADNSLAIRILMLGLGIADIPTARVLHHSTKDQIREDNQRNRSRDNTILTNKYMPYKRQWQQTFRQNYIYSGSTPWSHGLPVEVVAR